MPQSSCLRIVFAVLPLLPATIYAQTPVDDVSLIAHHHAPINEVGSMSSELDFSSVVNDTYTRDTSPQNERKIVDEVERPETRELCNGQANSNGCKSTPPPGPSPPTRSPTFNPTHKPTPSPSFAPTVSPSLKPTQSPTIPPTFAPTVSPSLKPTQSPTLSPTLSPTPKPVEPSGPRPGFSHSLLKNSATGNVPLTVTGQAGTTVDLLSVYDDTTLAFNVDSSGQSFTNGGTVASASDRRLKHNITDIDGALGKVLQMRGVEYNYNATLLPHTEGKRDMGFVAQEMEDVEPLLVAQPTSGSMEKYLHVEYAKVGPLLVEAIKEMQATFLDARLKEMTAQVDALEAHYKAGREKRQAKIEVLRATVQKLMDEEAEYEKFINESTR